jgi:hypothetical protein
LAVWLFVGLPWLNTPLDRIEYRDAPQHSGTQNNPDGSAQSPYFVQVIPTPKSAQKQKEEAEDREEKKSSDRWLVRWTFALFAANIGLIAATAVLGYFGWQQSKDMRESVNAANRSATAERALSDLGRPWIFIYNVTRLFSPSGSTNFRLNYTVANFGKIPALVEAARIGFVFEDSDANPQIPTFVSDDNSLVTAPVLQPGEERNFFEWLPENPNGEIIFHPIHVGTLDLPTSWAMATTGKVDDFTARMFEAINGMLLDMLAAVARKDYEDRRRRQMHEPRC